MYIYCKQINQEVISLPDDAIRHIKARRLNIGDSVYLFDGTGNVVTTEITHIKRNAVNCEVVDRALKPKQERPRLVIGVTK